MLLFQMVAFYITIQQSFCYCWLYYFNFSMHFFMIIFCQRKQLYDLISNIIIYLLQLYISLTMFKCLDISQLFDNTYTFQYGYANVPHPQKAFKGGEDAIFVSSNVLLVADGVSGWAALGVDPALYSKKLAKIVGNLVAKDQLKYINNPQLLIRKAVQLNKETGSTTVCLLTLHPSSGLLKTYYLGDSVYGIINPVDKKIGLVEAQQNQFNFPVQIGTNGENPLNGVYRQYKAEKILPQQIIIMATDGIWDNLKPELIYEYAVEDHYTLHKRSQTIAEHAKRVALLPQWQSPFYQKARKKGISCPKKGKLDDNSIILAKIKREIP